MPGAFTDDAKDAIRFEPANRKPRRSGKRSRGGRLPFDDGGPWTGEVVAAKPRTKRQKPPQPTSKRAALFASTGGRCAYCGDTATTLDHIVPRSRGGSNAASNLVPACRPCNTAKGSKMLHEWAPIR